MVLSDVVFCVFFIFFATEFSAWKVWGNLLRKEKINNFFSKYPIDEYRLNSLGDYMLYHNDFQGKYIAIGSGFLAKWHIEDIGRVPRWSMWHSVLNDYHRNLMNSK